MTGRVTARPATTPVDMVLPAEAASLAPIRRAVSALAAALGLSAERVEDVRVALTEACANVVVHAYGGLPGIIRVRAAAEDGFLRVTVRDEGRGLVPRLRATSPGLRLGLQMIAALADEVRFLAEDGGGTSVHMAFAMPAPA